MYLQHRRTLPVNRSATLEIKELNWLQRLISNSFRVFCFLFSVEPLKITDTDYKFKRLNSIYERTSKELEREERWRKAQLRWYQFRPYLFAYLTTRFLGALVVRVTVHGIGRSGRDMEKMNKFVIIIVYLIGDPAGKQTGLSFFMYGFSLFTLVYLLGFVPYYFADRPVDSVNLRFFFRPEPEVKRIDLAILEQLERLLVTIRQALEQLHLTCYNYSLTNMDRNKQRLSLSRRDSQRTFSNSTFSYRWHRLNLLYKLIEWDKNHIWRMRPAIYTSSWYVKLHTELSGLSVLSAWFTTSIVVYLYYSIHILCLLNKCNQIRESHNCHLTTVHDFPETLAIFELFFAGIFVCIAIICGVFALIYNTVAQFLVASDIGISLRNLLARLRYHNHQKSIRKLTADSTTEPELELCLVETLVNLTLSEDDFRKCAKFMSLLLEALLGGAGFSFVITLFTSTILSLPEVRQQSIWLVCALWLVTNLILLGCAYSFARIIELEQVAWSILAQLTVRSKHTNQYVEDEYVAIGWYKLVYSFGLSISTNAARPFGMSITYRKVLELNFLVISAVALVKTNSY